MLKVTNRFQNAVRADPGETSGSIQNTARQELDRRAESVREEFEGRTGETRQEVAARLFDLGEEYFPGEAARRRRRTLSVGVVVGFAAGFVARHVLGR